MDQLTGRTGRPPLRMETAARHNPLECRVWWRRAHSWALLARTVALRVPAATLGALLGELPAGRLAAQEPAPRVGLSFGIDTTAVPTGAIVHLVRDYLAAPDSTAVRRGLWSTRDPLDRRLGDVAAPLAYQGFPATILGVLSAGPGDSVYVVKLMHATADSGGRVVRPLAVQRLYAVRAPAGSTSLRAAPHGWQLAGALPRLTRDWPRRAAGRLEFRYAPGRRPDPARAARAARFVDSVAALFAVPAPARVTYLVTPSPDAYLRALGLDFFPLPDGPGTWRGGQGGQLPGGEGLVLAGDPTVGEANLHELAHAVLGERVRGGRTMAEGVATWLGGSRGKTLPELYAGLAAFQRAHPALTLEALLGDLSGGPGERARDEAQYATGALLVDGIYRRRGVAGLRALRTAPDSLPALLRFVAEQLDRPSTEPAALDRWWRATAPAFAAPPTNRAAQPNGRRM